MLTVNSIIICFPSSHICFVLVKQKVLLYLRMALGLAAMLYEQILMHTSHVSVSTCILTGLLITGTHSPTLMKRYRMPLSTRRSSPMVQTEIWYVYVVYIYMHFTCIHYTCTCILHVYVYTKFTYSTSSLSSPSLPPSLPSLPSS